MSETLIKVDNVSKKFAKNLKKSLYYGFQDVLYGVFGINKQEVLRKDEFWAVKNVSFEVKRGECLGLIGHNGAGKSTLLKMINGLISPDTGSITMTGKIGALIELGAGFNPILTGRENIYNNGAIIGFSKSEINKKFDEIVAFSELEDFIDMPVQNYSSGMRVRLGFAIAAQMEPDVLLIDEVLAVGDASFRAKCFNKIANISKNCAIIFVSHSMPLVGRVCDTGLLLNKGKVENHDAIASVINDYLENLNVGTRSIVGETEVDDFKISINKYKVKYSDDLEVKVEFSLNESYKNFILHYSIIDQEQKAIYQSFSSDENIIYQNNGLNKLLFTIKNIDLTNGKYAINVGIIENNYKGKNLFRIDKAAEFIVCGASTHAFASILKQTKWD